MTGAEIFDANPGPWRLDAAGRQLDAGVVRLAPGRREAERAEEADVLLCAVDGHGHVQLTDGDVELAMGRVVFVPRGRRFAVRAS